MTGKHKSWQKINTKEKKTLNKTNLVNNIHLSDQTNNTFPIGVIILQCIFNSITPCYKKLQSICLELHAVIQ